MMKYMVSRTHDGSPPAQSSQTSWDVKAGPTLRNLHEVNNRQTTETLVRTNSSALILQMTIQRRRWGWERDTGETDHKEVVWWVMGRGEEAPASQRLKWILSQTGLWAKQCDYQTNKSKLNYNMSTVFCHLMIHNMKQNKRQCINMTNARLFNILLKLKCICT